MVRAMDDGTSITKDTIYEAAASIGQSFRQFAERHGGAAAAAAVEGPMQRVISVLEQLEMLASRNEAQDSALTQLRLAAQALQVEMARRAAEERADQQELERSEETWEQDSQQRLKTIAKLREDNSELKRQIEASTSGGSSARSRAPGAQASLTEEDQTRALALLNQTAAEQRARIRELQRDNKEKAAAVESGRLTVRRLEEDNAILRLADAGSAAHALRLEEQQRQLEQALAELPEAAPAAASQAAEQPPADAAAAAAPPPPSCAAPIAAAASRERTGCRVAVLSEASSGQSAVSAGFPGLPGAAGRAAFEHEPRFTEKELRALYAERSEFRTRLADVQAELTHLKVLSSSESAQAVAASGSTVMAESADDCVDAPVQGPINREPWEKLYPRHRKQSKIVSFFKMLSSSPDRPSSPREFENSMDNLV